MEKKIEEAIERLTERITGTEKSEDALRFTQAALNLTHILATKDNIKRNNP